MFDFYRNYFDIGYDKLVVNLEEIELKFVEVCINNLFIRDIENFWIYSFWKDYIKDLNEFKIEIDNIVS